MSVLVVVVEPHLQLRNEIRAFLMEFWDEILAVASLERATSELAEHQDVNIVLISLDTPEFKITEEGKGFLILIRDNYPKIRRVGMSATLDETTVGLLPIDEFIPKGELSDRLPELANFAIMTATG